MRVHCAKLRSVVPLKASSFRTHLAICAAMAGGTPVSSGVTTASAREEAPRDCSLSLRMTAGGAGTRPSQTTAQNQATPKMPMEAAFDGFTGSPALQQMSHLGVYLRDCDDGRRQQEMLGCLNQLPEFTRTLAAQNLKRRAFWLAAEEKIEFDREKEIKIVRS